jgi:hypothetical protein
MDQRFEEQAHDAACRVMGEAVWQLIATGETVSQEAIANMIVMLAERRLNLEDSVALSVLNGTSKPF